MDRKVDQRVKYMSPLLGVFSRRDGREIAAGGRAVGCRQVAQARSHIRVEGGRSGRKEENGGAESRGRGGRGLREAPVGGQLHGLVERGRGVESRGRGGRGLREVPMGGQLHGQRDWFLPVLATANLAAIATLVLPPGRKGGPVPEFSSRRWRWPLFS